MYKVLIVDDERLIRVSIRQRVNWEKLGLTVAGMAGNGLEALQFIEQKRPDIVLVDIRMPLMDGLALIKEVRRKDIVGVHFVIISGYNDFDYARQAIRLGVSDYIQKPVDEQELENALRSIISGMENKATVTDHGLVPPERNDNPCNADEIAYCNAWLHGQPISGEDAFKHLGGPEYCLIQAVSTARLKPVLALKALEHAVGTANIGTSHLFFADSVYPEQLWVLISGSALVPRSFVNKLTSAGGFDAVVTPVFSDLAELPRLNNLTWTNLIHRLFKPMRPFVRLCVAELQPDSRLRATFQKMNSYLEEMICEHDLKGVTDTIRHIFDDCLIPAASPILLDRFIFSYSTMLVQAIGNGDSSRRQVVLTDILLTASSFEDLRMSLVSYASRVLGESAKSYPQDIIERIHQYIDQNFDDDLTLTEISKYFHLNACYLSQMFKAHSGNRLSEYIESVRIEKSRALLGIPNISVADAAARVGYSDANYFSKVFKKNTGMSPTQYQHEAGR